MLEASYTAPASLEVPLLCRGEDPCPRVSGSSGARAPHYRASPARQRSRDSRSRRNTSCNDARHLYDAVIRGDALAAAGCRGWSDPRFARVGNPIVREQVVVMRLPLHKVAVELAEPNEAAPILHAPDQHAAPVALPGQPAHRLTGLHPGQGLGKVE